MKPLKHSLIAGIAAFGLTTAAVAENSKSDKASKEVPRLLQIANHDAYVRWHQPFFAIILPGGDRMNTLAKVNGEYEFIEWGQSESGTWIPVVHANLSNVQTIGQYFGPERATKLDRFDERIASVDYVETDSGKWRIHYDLESGRKLDLASTDENTQKQTSSRLATR